MGIGSILKSLIETKKTNINALAENVGVSPQTLYSMIKRDNMKADLDVLFKLSDALDVDISVFYKEYKNQQSGHSNLALTTAETEHIQKYRTLDERGKMAVDNILEHEWSLAHAREHEGDLLSQDLA